MPAQPAANLTQVATAGGRLWRQNPPVERLYVKSHRVDAGWSRGQWLAKHAMPSVKMSPAEASNELQKIVNRNFDRRSEHSESFDSDSLSGLDNTPIQSNLEHFPFLMDSFLAARKLSSSFLPGANNSSPKDIALLPLPKFMIAIST
ncbi:hypothetical protein PCASD_12530 [Puccinia coronata f. sp. avenae]|uniref:Uncharacterized protein n=1 Tax=Puccinia coronata f. sp. avenae TaxID=200324 RepID=A0A2N5TBQ9_9BASI|nr:hypothetical protein PCASD_12530 [Puccinia coronata f. sp. avenae]